MGFFANLFGYSGKAARPLEQRAEMFFNPSYGMNQFRQLGSQAAGTFDTYMQQPASMGMSRGALGAIAGAQYGQSVREGVTATIPAFLQHRMAMAGQGSQLLSQAAQIRDAAEQRKGAFTTGLVNNVLGIAGTLGGQYMGNKMAQSMFSQVFGGGAQQAAGGFSGVAQSLAQTGAQGITNMIQQQMQNRIGNMLGPQGLQQAPLAQFNMPRFVTGLDNITVTPGFGAETSMSSNNPPGPLARVIDNARFNFYNRNYMFGD